MRVTLIILTVLATVMFYAGIDKLKSNSKSRNIFYKVLVSGAFIVLTGVIVALVLDYQNLF